ncbi:hypothetical protein Pmani_015087 [Petrolisthes manimaculis]|uniref:Uncharacterized protein n=1 Tax=Petrolisthes manimaculis TaxID=1843537 RepID=A0AAE1U815_9EUCA|nr:hypothetical protein Pmani_015087 [Petrolisthes manimaculis]
MKKPQRPHATNANGCHHPTYLHTPCHTPTTTPQHWQNPDFCTYHQRFAHAERNCNHPCYLVFHRQSPSCQTSGKQIRRWQDDALHATAY